MHFCFLRIALRKILPHIIDYSKIITSSTGFVHIGIIDINVDIDIRTSTVNQAYDKINIPSELSKILSSGYIRNLLNAAGEYAQTKIH
jgi:hypothetical protein